MQRTTYRYATVEQTAGATAVVWIVLKDLTTRDSFQNVIKRDVLGIHFLLSMLGDSYGLR